MRKKTNYKRIYVFKVKSLCVSFKLVRLPPVIILKASQRAKLFIRTPKNTIKKIIQINIKSRVGF